MRLYVASSWRCVYQPGVVQALREHGHGVYNFRNPRPGEHGFAWSEIDPEWQNWEPAEYIAALSHPVAQSGFSSDYVAMRWAEACVLVLPCGRSAHLEAGWFAGQNRGLHILMLEKSEPELMYRLADSVTTTLTDLLEVLQ